MTEPKTLSVEQVRRDMLDVVSFLLDQVRNARMLVVVQAYAEAAATLFDAASARQIDVPPDRGFARTARPAPIDVPPDRG